MKSGTKLYFKRVLEEIDNIKSNATKAEIKKLNISKLDGTNSSLCIYGQMTGNCWSRRAHELVEKCCVTTTSFTSLFSKETVNHAPILCEDTREFSFLEHCITSYRGNNAKIIAYLKGQIPTLELS